MRNRFRSARSWLVAGLALFIAFTAFFYAPDVLDSEEDLKIPDLKCTKCGSRAVFDDLPEDYLGFLLRP